MASSEDVARYGGGGVCVLNTPWPLTLWGAGHFCCGTCRLHRKYTFPHVNPTSFYHVSSFKLVLPFNLLRTLYFESHSNS